MTIRRQFFRMATALSILVLAALAALWMFGRHADGTLNLAGSLGIRVTRGELWAFNQGRPNRGYFILYMMPHGLPETREKELDVGGLYFRVMFTDKGNWWTLMVPLGYPIGLSLALPTISLVRWDRRRARMKDSRCQFCGYDLRESPSRCPECGVRSAGLSPSETPRG